MLFINSRYVLLTYAQCGDLDEWAVVDHLSALNAECIVGKELHPRTGGVHFHVFVDFGRKFRSRRVDILDVEGRHPNVVPSKGTPEKGYDYAIKDQDFGAVAGGLERPRGGRPGTISGLEAIAHLCETQDEFLDIYGEVDTRGLIKNFANVRSYAKWRYAGTLPKYESPASFGEFRGGSDGRDQWLAQSGIRSGDVVSKFFPMGGAYQKRPGGSTCPHWGPPQGAHPPVGPALSC